MILFLLNFFFSVNKNCGGFSYHVRINPLDATFEEQNDSRDESMKLIRLMRSRLGISGRWDEDALKEKVHICMTTLKWVEYPRILFFPFVFNLVSFLLFFSKKVSYFGMVKVAVPFEAYKSE